MDDFRRPVQQTNNTYEPVASVEGTETYETPTGEPARLEPTPPPAPEKKKSRVGKYLLWGLMALLLAGLGSLAYWQWAEAESAKKEVTSLQEQYTTLQTSQKKSTENSSSAELSTEKQMTTAELSDKYASAYKKSSTSTQFFTRVEKIEGDFTHIYTKAEAPGAEPMNMILKRSGDTLVFLDSYGPYMLNSQAEFLKSLYGLDVVKLGIKTQAQ